MPPEQFRSAHRLLPGHPHQDMKVIREDRIGQDLDSAELRHHLTALSSEDFLATSSIPRFPFTNRLMTR